MAGRGRGRGRGKGLSFNVENLGFGRGEALPTVILQPPAVYPPLEFKPVPLAAGEEYDYLLALKQEYTTNMRDSVYFIKPPNKKKDIQRYSDKYQLGQQDNSNNWEPDWARLPSELRLRVKRKTKVKAIIKPKLIKAAMRMANKQEDIVKTLEELEKKEVQGNEEEETEEKPEKKKEGEEEEEEEELEEYYDEEELEEETDYNLTYFDNGENEYDEDDDLDEGAIY